MSSSELFINHIKTLDKPKVLELGTLQWVDGVSTHHGEWLPSGSTHIKSDVEPGNDVDVVADAHDLSPFEDGEFDAFIAVSVWEHLRKPWIASAEVARVVKPGGILYVATHFAFPVHGYPSDYCRWTDEGLKGLFDEPEWHSQEADYAYPCIIKPPREVTVWNALAPAFLNVGIFAVRA
jgi:SAM-dependent methyltransferase